MTVLDEQRALVAEGCRVAAARGLVDGILGHLSLRVDDERLLIRCRSDTDAGVAYTRPGDIRLITFDGGAGAAGELDGYRVPNELPIHVETMLADSRHRAVAHLHPPAVVAADLAGLAIRPIYGAFDIPGAWLARGGVPVYERAVLIRTPALGKEMVAAMRGRPLVICRGHGITSAAATVQHAVLQAIIIERAGPHVAAGAGRRRDPARDRRRRLGRPARPGARVHRGRRLAPRGGAAAPHLC